MGKSAIKAARLILGEIRTHIEKGNNFALETTFSGHGYLSMIRKCRELHGYHVKLIFLSLETADEAIARVGNRVRQGGHNVPDQVVYRRFHAGLRQFHEVYKPEVNFWRWYDNGGREPRLLDEGGTE